MMRVELSAGHAEAVNRRRRVTVQYDAHGQMGADLSEWLDFRFAYVDQPGAQVDCVCWDIGAGSWAVYPSEVLPRFEHPGLRIWWDQGIDWVAELVRETHQRGLEAFWNHRVSEVDISPTPELEPGHRLMMDQMNPVKREHPDWVIKTWWWQGLWNYACPELREYQLAILREIAQKYDLDGFQLDFARHIPCLPPGRQWELRGEVTQFVGMVRGMLQEIAGKRGRPYLLATRIPETIEGCRADGFDVGTWAREGLVDILTLGTRSMNVDIEAFARETAGCNVKLQPCFDDHHATDGYRFQGIEFLRGVFANWWARGAHGVATFNWANASPEMCEEYITRRWQRGSFNEGEHGAQGQAYREIGSPRSLAGKSKVFAVERRGGYPWAEGYFNHNAGAPLPLTLLDDGSAVCLDLHLSDPVRDLADTVERVALRAVVFGAREGDRFGARLNGVELDCIAEDHGWKDPQILSPAPQPPSGGSGNYPVDPDQRLLRVDFAVPPAACNSGWNRAELRVDARVPYVAQEIALEKLELHLEYGEGSMGG